jgi:putative oligomerization/nucleic acid binding protein/phospholipase D-like protein
MVVGADYPLLDVIWTILVFFGFVIWIWTLFMVFADLFSRHDLGGWGKAGWTLLVIVLPLLGVLIYLIAEGKGMAERRAKDIQTSQSQFDQHIRTVAGGPAGEISQAKALLDSGAITPQEYEQLKSKALAGEAAAPPSTPQYAG